MHRPLASGHQHVGAFEPIGASCDSTNEELVFERAFRSIRGLLYRLLNHAKDSAFDNDDVLERFGYGPSVRCRLVVELFTRKAPRGVQVALPRFFEVLRRVLAFGRRHWL